MKIHYSNHISWQLLDNNVYIIDEITRGVHILEDVGRDFWMLIAYGNSFEDIVQILSERYDVSKDVLMDDLNEFKETLFAQDLIKGEF